MTIPSKRCCNTCEELKTIECFHTNRNKEKISYRHRCIECDKNVIKQRNQEQYAKNRVKRLEISKIQYKNKKIKMVNELI